MLTAIVLFASSKTMGQFWMQRGGGLTIDEATSITSDGNNNTYTTGYFTTTFSIEGNSINSAGLDDIFILKTASNGNVVWLKRAGGPNVDKALSIASDNSGNIVVTGFFYVSAEFNGQTIVSSGQQDIFIAKYDATGNLLWVKKAGGTGSDAGNGVAIDNSGNVIITGEFTGSCSFDAVTLTSQNNSIDVFTAKYDSNGNLLWAKKGSGKYTDRGTDVATDAAGNIYVSGMFSDTITFDLQHDNPMYNAMFVIKYNTSGSEQWFRWMGSGSVVNMGGISVHANDVNVTGNFNGTLFFLGIPSNPTLSSNYTNNIFVSRFDLSGNLIWSHADGSINEVTAEAIATRSNGEVIVSGNFKCRMSDFSSQYDDGIFCSVGYWDTYVSSYDNNGNWMWARQYGGQEDDHAFGITVLPNDKISQAGSFKSKFISPFLISTFTTHGQPGVDFNLTVGVGLSYCSFSNYLSYFVLFSYGNSDIFINSNIDITRPPYDYFERTGSLCVRPFNDICISNSINGLNCQDTIASCSQTYLVGVDLNMRPTVSPNVSYAWNTGASVPNIIISTSGYYHVKVSTVDGCFHNLDTIYYLKHPTPVDPLISDSKGINTNALNTLPITVCLPDSVILTCTNPGANTVKWTGFPQGQNPVTVNTGGIKQVTLTNQFGCISNNAVNIIAGNALPIVDPKMRCLQDTDGNDTLELCLGDQFNMYLYDEISNPGGVNLTCFPELSSVSWNTNQNPLLNYLTSTSCFPGLYAINFFVPQQVGSFNVLISAWIYRSNPCDSDSVFVSKQLFIIVNPIPTTTINFSLTGPSHICPGDSALLVASPPNYNYSWNTGSTNDSIYVKLPGTYYVIASVTITNQYGCTNIISQSASINVSHHPQPTVTMLPANGLICPNDSVQLTCTGTSGFVWQGPNGTLGGNVNNVYVSNPGFYYCIQTVAPGCNLVSNTVQVFQYNTPFITGFPSSTLCTSDTVILTAITNPGSGIQWQPPLAGSSLSQAVTQAGTYSCTVNSCSIVTSISFTVQKDSALAEITSSGNMNSFCEGDSVLLSANSGMASYLWLPSGISATSIYASQAGTYSLVTTSPQGCTDTASITLTEIINSNSPPYASDTLICAGQSALLTASGFGPVFWSSSPSYSTIVHSGNTFQLPELFYPVTYYLFTQDSVCKSGLSSITVNIDEHCDLFDVPNVFTPNEDGFNDFFMASNGSFLLDISIYNRWGQIIYMGSKIKHGWDGRASNGEFAPDGTYFYVLSAYFFDNSIKRKSGFITLIKE